MKKIVKRIMFAIVVICTVYAIYKIFQPEIKVRSIGRVSVTIYDNDQVDGERLKKLDSDTYKYRDCYRELLFNPNDIDDTQQYGKSFEITFPFLISRKELDGDFEIYYEVDIPDELKEYIFVSEENYIASTLNSEFIRWTKNAPYDMRLYGCTNEMDDEELIELVKCIRVKAYIKDAEGNENSQNVRLWFNGKVKHEEAENDYKPLLAY